ncbi:pyridoxal phosphate-dependent aminotransferase [Fusibacter sp. JL216-2]|uniref:pyridoxal phosphate-dependent aminotransferase n=1 Tax=Fusibacter sp. JL216-2 TaxID=3071453 RepID=UPI003D349F0F
MLSKKMFAISPSVTIGISTKVAELRRRGEDIISLSIGEPDFMTPDGAKDAAVKAIEANKTKYDAAAGLIELRQAICKKLKEENDLEYNINEIVVSSGAKHAITNTLTALLDHGDDVLIPKPYWTSYPEMVKLCGGNPVFVETQKKNNFKLSVEDLRAAHTEKTKIIFITNPSNPSGAVYTKEELLPVVNYCIENNIYIIADEIYERICYLDQFTSIASLSEEARKMTIVINGLSKSAAMTGWRLGYTASQPEIAKAIGTIQGHLVSHPSTITQWAALGALTECQSDMDKMVKTYKTRRDEALKRFEAIDGVSLVQPDGAFYLFADMSIIKDKLEFSDSFSVEICNRLLEDYKLAVVPGIAFGLDDYIRLSYAADINDVREGISRIQKFVDGLR